MIFPSSGCRLCGCLLEAIDAPVYSNIYGHWFCSKAHYWQWVSRVTDRRIKQDKLDRVYGDDEISF